MNIKDSFYQLGSKIDALSLRERVALFGALLLAVFGIVDYMMLTPVRSAETAREKERQQWNSEISATNQKLWALQSVQNGAVSDLNRKKQLDLDIEKATNAVKSEFASTEEGFKDIVITAKALLEKHDKIELINLKVLSPTPLLDDKNKNKEDFSASGIPWEYSIEFEIKGQYLDLLKYSHALEKKLVDSRWRNIEVKYDDKNMVTLMTFKISNLILKQDKK